MARRNPMPLSGAIFLKNPRRKNRKSRRRRNRSRRGYTRASRRRNKGRRSSPYSRVLASIRNNRGRKRKRRGGRRRRNSYRGVAAVMRNRGRRRRRGRGRRRRNSYRGVAAVMRNRGRKRGRGRLGGRRRNKGYMRRRNGVAAVMRNRGYRRRNRRGRGRRRRNSTYILRNRGWRRVNRGRKRGRGRRRRNSTYILRNRGWRRVNSRRRRRGYGRRRRNSTYILRNRGWRRVNKGRRRRNRGYRRRNGVAMRMNTASATTIPILKPVTGILYRIPVIGKVAAPIVGGGASGALGLVGVHFVLAGVGPVPGLGQYLPDVVQPFAYTLGGGVLGLAAGFVPGKLLSSRTKVALATVSVVGGGAVDAYRWLSGETSWFGWSAPGILGGGGSAPADDMMAAAYADSAEADALVSGADLDPAEGQAALAGPGAWMQSFPMTKTATRVANGPTSRHANKHGHRWGWLIKMIGWDRFQRLAALPANQRVQYLDQLRQHAVAASQAYAGHLYAGG